MSVLSIQSAVAYGHVGNSAARPALQRLGIETIAIDTVTLAHHPAHGSWRGRVTTAAELAALLDGVEALGALSRCDAVLSGYLGDAALGPGLLEGVRKVKAANPTAIYCCDPVMGDGAMGFYVRDSIPEFFRDRALPVADWLMPNLFELGWLAEAAATPLSWTLETALVAARKLIARGPRLVVVKGLRRTARGRMRVGALAVSAAAAWYAEAPLIDVPSHGAGDLFAALFVGHRIKGRRIPHALARAVSGVHAVLTRTAAEGADEMALIPAQDRMIAPKRLFKAAKIG